jgi:FMN phosphatase YigB (HAD superfamily)
MTSAPSAPKPGAGTVPSLQAPIREIVVDFAGTLARPAARLAAYDVVKALHGAYQWTSPPDFTAALNRAIKQARVRDQHTSRQTVFADLLTAAADACGAHLPEPADAVQATVFAALPDAHIDHDAASAVRDLAARGYRLILADNTRRPLAARERTLRHAGILDCFEHVLLSSELGTRKPNHRFYISVLRVSNHPPEQVLFVGDNAAHDVEPPRALGTNAVLVAPVWRQRDAPGTRPPVFAELPHLLKAAVR